MQLVAAPANDAVDWLLDNFGWLFDAIGTVATDVVEWIESVLTAASPAVMIALSALIPLLLPSSSSRSTSTGSPARWQRSGAARGRAVR